MTPAVPLPLDLPLTSTFWPASKTPAVTPWPSVYSEALSVRISARYRRGVTPAFSKRPATGLVTLGGLISPKPIWTAEYLSLSGVRTAVTTQGPACTTVTGTTCPVSSKTWVMPSLVPRIPVIAMISESSELDLDVDASRKVEPHQRVDSLQRRVDDVDQPLVRPHLEVLARVLVLVRRADDAVHVLLGRQRHGTGNFRASTSHPVDGLPRRAVDDLVVICLEPDADLLSRHSGLGSSTSVSCRCHRLCGAAYPAATDIQGSSLNPRNRGAERGPAAGGSQEVSPSWARHERCGGPSLWRLRPPQRPCYLLIFVTPPAPTVRPPSPIAKP